MGLIELFQNDYTLRIVSLGSGMLGMISGIVGSFAVLRKQGLLGDAVSHAALPGIAIMFILLGTKSTEMFMLGALVAGLTATWLIHFIDKNSRIKMDSSMALILSVFFGFGLVLLTYIQKIPNANQAGLDKFIFGQASTMIRQDVYTIFIVGGLLILMTLIFWKELKLVSFDSDFADSIGISSRKVSLILSSMIVVSIIIGLQTVGVILMSAMLVAPGVAARQWTDRLSVMVILAGIFGSVSGILGTLISSSIVKMPTGPAIVLIISLMVVVSITMSPNRGLVWRMVREYRNRKHIDEDKVLFSLYRLALNHDDMTVSHDSGAFNPLIRNGKIDRKRLSPVLEKLQSKGLIQRTYFDQWAMTEEGIAYLKEHPFRKGEEDERTS